MSEASTEYWAEAVGCAFDESGAWDVWKSLTDEQKAAIARSLEIAHECHGMAFYSPPASDGIARVEREWKAKYEKLEREMEAFRGDAAQAVKIALNLRHDARVSIHKHGAVFQHGGRTEQIQ